MTHELIEAIGYLGSAGIMLSFLMREAKAIRYINMVGCLFFVVYAALLGWKWPIIIPNLFIFSTHLYFLFLKGGPTRG